MSTATVTPGRKFFDEHMEYIMAKDFAAMVNETYTDDCVLVHNFAFFDDPPPYTVRGKEAIIEAETKIFQRQGDIEPGEPFNFVEGDDFLAFQIIVTSPNTGRWLINDVWHLRDGKIDRYFAFGYHLEDD
ncbi:MAG TPA: nuclear transport factor 2 family protein [Thermoguttaceae bacterium]|nr:nuclear transport factor 2 family protein [Thermoguttaceae bacterium]